MGKIKTGDDKVTHIPTIIEDGYNKGQVSVCIAKSNIEFDSGKIEFYVTFKDQKNTCQLILSHNTPTETFVGYNFGKSAFGIGNYSGGKWDGITATGDESSLPINQKIKTVIIVRGSNIDLYVDDVKVCSGVAQIVKSQLAIFFNGKQEIIVENFKSEKVAPKAFVVMQFSAEYNELYEEVIKPTCTKFGLEVIRADDMYTNSLILEDITKSIRESSVVIADITADNPNVFYEVGYSHAINKPTILLSDKKRAKLPFDVSGFRTLFYENSIGGKRTVEDNLYKYLQNINI
ncbi:MAG: hypothetical protein HY096_01865 [Nitrospinae bacterium]|nr:hypothetical protein [Nitrospinota bacterium]